MTEDVSAYFYGVKEDVSADYKDLASFLGIHDTRNIESRNRDATSCCMDVLETWKRLKGDQATVEVLEQALFSAELQSAADNLRRRLSEGNYPTAANNQHNVEVPEMAENASSENGEGNYPTAADNQHNVEMPKIAENASSENGGFSCSIGTIFRCYYIHCEEAFWFGLFYTICVCVFIISNPGQTWQQVVTITVFPFALLLMYANYRMGRPTRKSARLFLHSLGPIAKMILVLIYAGVICQYFSETSVKIIDVFIRILFVVWCIEKVRAELGRRRRMHEEGVDTSGSSRNARQSTPLSPVEATAGRTNTIRHRNS